MKKWFKRVVVSVVLSAVVFSVSSIDIMAKSTPKLKSLTISEKVTDFVNGYQKITFGWNKASGTVKVVLLDSNKKVVSTLYKKKVKKAGKHSFVWDAFIGKGGSRTPAPSGNYTVKATFGKSVKTKKFAVKN